MRWLKLVCLAALPVVLLTRCSAPSEPAPVEAPNVILIGLDTVRFDAFFLPERAGMPDALSDDLKQSVVFTKALAAAPWTEPSVASVLTGLYPAQHGAGRFDAAVANLDEAAYSHLNDSFTTLAERLKSHGFKTVLITSHPMLKPGQGLAQGFSEFHSRNGDDNLVQRAREWLKQEHERPFFLYVHLMWAHEWPTHGKKFREHMNTADPALLKAARRLAPDAACAGKTKHMCKRWQVYIAAIAKQRALVASLLETLRSEGLMDSTLVVLYADHGEEFHDHLQAERRWGMDPRGFYGVGHGQSLFQELLHVPLVVWHPALPGQSAGQVVSLVDVTPSILNWLGLNVPEKAFAGRPISGLKREGADPFSWEEYDPSRWPEMDRKLFASGIAYGPEQIAVITDGWKYIWHAGSGKSYLFNLRKDPHEHHPVVVPEVIKRLEPALDRYFSLLTERPSETASLSEQQIRELKGVGYLQGVEVDDS